MENLIIMDRQDGSPIELAAGVRKPRSGSSRKPRSASHTLLAFDRDSGSPPTFSLSGSPSDGYAIQEENGHFQSRSSKEWQGQKNAESTFTRTPGHGSGERDKAPFSEERNREFHKEGGDFKGHGSSDKMGDGEGRSEWKMFQRREKRRDEWSYERDPNRSGKKSWKDADGDTEKGPAREESKRAGSPEYERMKKLERIWKEKAPSEKSYKDSGYRDKGDHSYKESGYRDKGDHLSKSSWHRDRGSYSSRDWDYRDRGDYSFKDRGYRDRGDYSSKDREYRDRGDRFHHGHRDWGSRDHSRERDYQKVRRVPDSRENYWKVGDGPDRGDSLEKHRSQPQNGSASMGHSHGSQPQNGSASMGHSLGGQSQNGSASMGHSLGSQSQNGSASMEHSHGGHERKSLDKLSDFHNEKSSTESRPLTKLKLKVGGVTHTIHPDGKRQSDSGRHPDGWHNKSPQGAGLPLRRPSSAAPEPNKRRQRLILQENSDDEDDGIVPQAKELLQDPAESDGFMSYLANEQSYYKTTEDRLAKVHDPMPLEPKDTVNQPLQGVRKSSRVPKKRVLDGDEDGEAEPKRRRRKRVEIDSDEDLYQIEGDEEEEDSVEEDDDIESFGEERSIKRRRRKRIEADSSAGDGKREVPLTARQRALQSSKEGGYAEIGASLIEFPEGLTQSFPKKQKENLTAAERQLKKEEAARKRRQQVEKAAKEIQAVAIHKILCQDSQRKKREGKLQKQRQEIEQEKKAAALAPASNSIRWVLGPTGNVVSFSQDLELPKIFSGPCSYPQERERCAGPSCNNVYKYRDSKTLLPLCSLQCYRAVRKPSEVTLAQSSC